MPVYLKHSLQAEVAARNAGLIAHQDQSVTGFPQPPERFARAWCQVYLVRIARVARVGNKDAVPVQKERPGWGSRPGKRGEDGAAGGGHNLW